jgi:2-methylcitrate dehydratase PrpD
MSTLALLESLHDEVLAGDFPAPARDRAVDRLLDGLSTIAASYRYGAPAYLAAAGAAADMSPAAGPCWIVGTAAGRPAETAALVNSAALHGVLYEDINFFSGDHPGAPIVPAALAAAEESGATIGTLIEGILIGYETHLALGAIGAPGVKARGFRTTSVFGTVGAAAAAAHIAGLRGDAYSTAVRFGANFSFGTIEGFAEGSTEPFLQAGVAASLGILAVRLARSGATASQGTFDGANGYLRAFADVPPGSAAAPGKEWLILDVSCKEYPISAGKISSMDTAVAVAERRLDPKSITGIVARVPQSAVSFPGADRAGEFSNFTQAQDSTPFCIAAALCGRDVRSLDTYLSGYGDPEVAELTRRIELVGAPDRVLTELAVTFADGETVTIEADSRANRIPSIAKMTAKLAMLGDGLWGAAGCEQIIGLVTGGPGVPVSELGAALRAGAGNAGDAARASEPAR